MSETEKKPKAAAKPRKTAAKKATVTEISSHAAQTHAAPAHSAPSHEEVSKLAHQFWIERGRQDGHHVEDWFRAEQALRSKAS